MNRSTGISRSLIALVLIAFTGEPEPQAIKLDASSRLWIDGSSTLGYFTCLATRLDGEGHLAESDTRAASETRGRRRSEVRGKLSVAVASFDCGNGAMNRDLRRALDSDDHPFITFTMKNAHVLDRTPSGHEMRVHVSGSIAIAGVERAIATIVRASVAADGRVGATGSKKLFMSDFGIDPPSALLGIIKASDGIEVGFDLVAMTETDAHETTTTPSASRHHRPASTMSRDAATL